MTPSQLDGLDLETVETPAFVIDLDALRRNLQRLAQVQSTAHCKILLALKGFAMWATFPLVRQFLPGIAASSLHEARLGREQHGGEVHTYSPGYSPNEIDEILALSDHVVFNSFSQWQRYRHLCHGYPSKRFGIRINPEHREVKTALYDPCAPGSRLGVTLSEFRANELSGITGLHLHTLCELGADALARTVVATEEKFGEPLRKMDWINLGGGHHITREDYDVPLLAETVARLRDRYQVDVILEPGEAIALGTGVLVASVVDLVTNSGVTTAILDTSATAHMPDTLEMPYRPTIVGGALPGHQPHTYRLGGLTCLAGDVLGDWSFAHPLRVGDRLRFLDMAHYTMVKTTTFNGVRLPDIATYEPSTNSYVVVKRFGYSSYRDRLS